MQEVKKYISDNGKLYDSPIDALIGDLEFMREDLSTWVITRFPSILHTLQYDTDPSLLVRDFATYERSIIFKLSSMRITVESFQSFCHDKQ